MFCSIVVQTILGVGIMGKWAENKISGRFLADLPSFMQRERIDAAGENGAEAKGSSQQGYHYTLLLALTPSIFLPTWISMHSVFWRFVVVASKGEGCKASHSSITKYHNQEDKEITHYRFQKEIMDYLFVFMLICANRRCSVKPRSWRIAAFLLKDLNCNAGDPRFVFPMAKWMADTALF